MKNSKRGGASMRLCRFPLPFWANKRIDAAARVSAIRTTDAWRAIVHLAVKAGTLTFDCPCEIIAAPREDGWSNYQTEFSRRDAAELERLAKPLGLTFRQAVPFVLRWQAMHLPRTTYEVAYTQKGGAA